ncbi:MAG: SGNH/GDSL hydrolase family protein [Christensenellaceae bacterium]|nr:SGNH/GDSL hydrolase family protein [Christensenellaceae bacterium]
MRVLFIGNSFTYFNEMQELFQNLCVAAGHDVVARRRTVGGYGMEHHTAFDTDHGKAVLADLAEGWDYVVLQGQSAQPALNRQVFLDSAKILAEKVREAGAKPVFYQTWAYQDGTEKIRSTGLGYAEFFGELKKGYAMAAAENDAPQVYVGQCFFALNQPEGPLNLICEDHFHPTLLGSFAAAVCFFRHFFPGETSAWIPEGVTEEQANIIWQYPY